jgi:hypothetical protein
MTARALALMLLALPFVVPIGASRAAQKIPSGADILERLEEDYLASRDLQARLVGFVATADQKFPVDVAVRLIVKQDIFRLDFEEPQALADNFLLLSGNKMYNYNFITNTVLVSDARRANASALGNFDLTSVTRFPKLVPLDKVTLKPTRSEKTPLGDAYTFEATAKPGSGLLYARAKLWVLESRYRPYRIQAFKPDGSEQFDMTVSEWRYNANLDAKKVTALPKGADVINR